MAAGVVLDVDSVYFCFEVCISVCCGGYPYSHLGTLKAFVAVAMLNYVVTVVVATLVTVLVTSCREFLPKMSNMGSVKLAARVEWLL